MKLTKDDVAGMILQAGADLRQVSGPTGCVTPDDIVSVADKHDLPIGLDIASDPVARTIFIAAFCGEARKALEAGIDAVWRRLQQLSQLAVA